MAFSKKNNIFLQANQKSISTDQFRSFIAEVHLEDIIVDNEGRWMEADEFLRSDLQNRDALCTIMNVVMEVVVTPTF